MKRKLRRIWEWDLYRTRASARLELFFPFANHDRRPASRLGIDIEFIDQPFCSGQAQAEGIRCAVASRERPFQISNSRAVIHESKFQPDAASPAQDADSG